MPDVYYDSTLTGQELDEALRNIPDSVKRSEAAAKAAESWAQGGTETRPGEDEDNAEYWAKQAKTDAGTASAGAQVVTDNREALQAVLDNLDAVKNAAKNAELANAAADSAKGDAERAELAADRAQSIGQGALGYYPKAADLQAAHETGENGQWAIIGETDTIWVWDSDTNAWSNSGNKTDLSRYYTKEEADAALEKTTQELNESLDTTTRTLTETVETAKQEALGMVMYLYSAALTVGGWRGDDGAGYTQTVPCTPEKEGGKEAGPAVTAATQLGIPMARPIGVQETDEALQAALGIINSGTVTPGEGTVTVKVWEKPETEITVYWYGRPGEGGGFVSGGGGGGGGGEIILRAKGTDGVAVEATLNGKTYKGTVGPLGFVDIPLKELGSYTVKVSKDAYTYTQTVNVYQYGITECWALANKPFIDCTPEEIQAIAKAGMASKYWQHGDRHKITMNDKEEIYVVIADFDHDVRPDGSKIPLTLIMEDCFNTRRRLNASRTNTGGWETCEFRTSTLPSILSNFPDEWQAVMTTCQKNTSVGDNSSHITTTEDTIWLLSEIEVTGSNSGSAPGEGIVYPIFTDNDSRIKTVSAAADSWWLRSPFLDREVPTGFCGVYAAGAVWGGPLAANGNSGVALGFCVG